MKYLILICLITTLPVYADQEHRTGQEARPSSKEFSFSRGCFQEISKLGCGHPREDQELFNLCLSDKILEVSHSCQSFFEKLYGKRRLKNNG